VTQESRREFVQNCITGGVLVGGFCGPTALQAAPITVKTYSRVKLVDAQGQAFKASSLSVRKNYVFRYPFESTPVFLLRMAAPVLGKKALSNERGDAYTSLPGVGPNQSVLAYSAICAHKLAYPTPQVSFISFQPMHKLKNGSSSQDVIHCCADHSQYDVHAGASVLTGPAPQPLTSIVLEYDAKNDELFAIGTLGGEVYDAFFAKYDFKLQMDHGSAARRLSSGTTVVKAMDEYCRQTAVCGAS
jgi:arsenite oxidase small subunit